MNSSFRDLFAWILSLDLPSISVIWAWLINVPWWVALLTIYLAYQAGRGLIYVSWKSYAWLCDRSDSLGQRLRKWWAITRQAFQRLLLTTRSFGRWLLQLLAIR